MTTTTTEDRSFAGLQINGRGYGDTHDYKPQYPKEQLAPLVQDLLDAPGVESFSWTQYTPYFNDGDVCEFRINTDYKAGVKLAGIEGDDDEGDALAGTVLPDDVRVVGGQLTKWVTRPMTEAELASRSRWTTSATTGSYEPYGDPFPSHPAADAIAAFYKALDSGHYDAAVQELFGNHCTVTVSKDGITVDEYEHD